jgi:myo-inositol-1(or 4)-monophosphatase
MKEFIKELLLGSGKILKNGFLTDYTIEKKGIRNPVTEIDKKSEEFIVNKISSKFPDHSIITEEDLSVHRGKSVWIIDPLDGTCNFAHGIPHFCISIAFVEDNITKFGGIYEPNRDELFLAEYNQGATLNGNPISISNNSELIDSMLATGFAYNRNEVKDTNVDNFNSFIFEVEDIRRMGSAALDLCYVATGRFDGFWELYLNSWDVAAGILLVQEAGGKVTNENNEPYKFGQKIVVASNNKIHNKIITILNTNLK